MKLYRGKNMLTYGSLFSGIGGLDLGLDRAGMQCKWQIEVNEHATKILERHWPDVTRFRDVRECGAHNLEPVDLICGGFPCQDISNAGKRAGIEGSRSGLWSEFYRTICELRPRYVLVENVTGLLYRGIERVLGDLAQSGYDAEWQMLPAEAFGFPHKRERIFVVAYNHRRQYPVFSASKKSLRISQDIQHRQRWLNELGAMCSRYGGMSYSDIRRDFYGFPRGVDRLERLGNAVVPQIAEYIGRCIMAHAA